MHARRRHHRPIVIFAPVPVTFTDSPFAFGMDRIGFLDTPSSRFAARFADAACRFRYAEVFTRNPFLNQVMGCRNNAQYEEFSRDFGCFKNFNQHGRLSWD
jgi:hypothetical protein